jgi:hypothetical protein
MAGQGFKYNVDIVMCIDCTGSMSGILDTVKANALKFYPDLRKKCDENGKEIAELRIKAIAYRDFTCDGDEAIAETEFFNIPDNEEDFKGFVSHLVPKGGGPEPESGLEALSMAINSKWTTGGDRRRHVIVVWSDASTHPLGDGNDNSCYPSGMPSSFDMLTDWWEDEQSGKMDKSAKRLIIFAPDASAWTEIGTNWTNAIHHPAKAGAGLSDVDYETIISSIVKSI